MVMVLTGPAASRHDGVFQCPLRSYVLTLLPYCYVSFTNSHQSQAIKVLTLLLPSLGRTRTKELCLKLQKKKGEWDIDTEGENEKIGEDMSYKRGK